MPGVASAILPDARRFLVIGAQMLIPSTASSSMPGGHDARRILVRREHRASQPGLVPDAGSEDGGIAEGG